MTPPDEMPDAEPVSPPATPGDRSAAMAGVRLVQLEVPDLDGGLRAKLVSVPKALSAAGAAMCTIMFGLTQADDVYESPVTSADNGYPDLVMRPDMTTLRRLPWCEATMAVLCDLFGTDGAACPLAPRTVLRAVADRCTDSASRRASQRSGNSASCASQTNCGRANGGRGSGVNWSPWGAP